MNTCILTHDEVDVLRSYVIEEYGGIFVYLPSPFHSKQGVIISEDRKARACFEELRSRKAVRGGPWTMRLAYVRERNKELLPELFNGRIETFEIYRIDLEYWKSLIGS